MVTPNCIASQICYCTTSPWWRSVIKGCCLAVPIRLIKKTCGGAAEKAHWTCLAIAVYQNCNHPTPCSYHLFAKGMSNRKCCDMKQGFVFLYFSNHTLYVVFCIFFLLFIVVNFLKKIFGFWIVHLRFPLSQ